MTPQTAARQTPSMGPNTLSDMLGRMGRGETVQVIAASPDAPVAREIFARLPALAARGVRIEAIFAKAGSSALVRLAAEHGARVPVRVMNLAAQGDIFEQVNFGAGAVWTGQKVKSAPAAFEDGVLKMAGAGGDKAKMAAMAFRALWAVSDAAVSAGAPANDAGAEARRKAG